MMMAATTMTMMTTEMTDGKCYMKLRHEQKHQISRMEDLVLAERLSKLFERDSHAASAHHEKSRGDDEGGDGVWCFSTDLFDPCGRRRLVPDVQLVDES